MEVHQRGAGRAAVGGEEVKSLAGRFAVADVERAVRRGGTGGRTPGLELRDQRGKAGAALALNVLELGVLHGWGCGSGGGVAPIIRTRARPDHAGVVVKNHSCKRTQDVRKLPI